MMILVSNGNVKKIAMETQNLEREGESEREREGERERDGRKGELTN